MGWQLLIPASIGAVGSICIGLTLVLVLVDMPGGVNWSKIAGWFAVIGGFGALGGVGGWIGQQIMAGQDRVMSFSQQYGAQLIGGGIVVVVLFGAGLWAYKHLMSKGIEAGGKSTWMKKGRSLLKAGALSLVGATIAAAIPKLYESANWVVGHAHSLIS